MQKGKTANVRLSTTRLAEYAADSCGQTVAPLFAFYIQIPVQTGNQEPLFIVHETTRTRFLIFIPNRLFPQNNMTMTSLQKLCTALFFVLLSAGAPAYAAMPGGDDGQLIDPVTGTMIMFPNAFTPNGDGLNDFWQPLANTGNLSISCVIYSRTGQQVYSKSSPSGEGNIMWDGRLNNGGAVIEGVYFYLVTGHYQDGRAFSKSGAVMVLR